MRRGDAENHARVVAATFAVGGKRWVWEAPGARAEVYSAFDAVAMEGVLRVSSCAGRRCGGSVAVASPSVWSMRQWASTLD